MKKDKLTIRISENDKEQIKKAVAKYHKVTGGKQTTSAAIRYLVHQYTSINRK